MRELDVRQNRIHRLHVLHSGTSSRHVKSIADEVQKQVKAVGLMPLGVEGERDGEWVLVDLGEIVVHVFLPRVREFYDGASVDRRPRSRRAAAGANPNVERGFDDDED